MFFDFTIRQATSTTILHLTAMLLQKLIRTMSCHIREYIIIKFCVYLDFFINIIIIIIFILRVEWRNFQILQTAN